MMFMSVLCRVLALLWLAGVVLIVTVIAIYLNGFWDGLRHASLVIFSPLALYYLVPTFILLGASNLLKRAASTDTSEQP